MGRPHLHEIGRSAPSGLRTRCRRRQMRSAPGFHRTSASTPMYSTAAFAREVQRRLPVATSDAGAATAKSLPALAVEREEEDVRSPTPASSRRRSAASTSCSQSDAFVRQMSHMSRHPRARRRPARSSAAASTRRTTAATSTSTSTSTSTRARALYRRLNILVYFNARLEGAQYGGVLDLWDEDVEHCPRPIRPDLQPRRRLRDQRDELARGDAGVVPAAGRCARSFAAYYSPGSRRPGLGRRQALDRLSRAVPTNSSEGHGSQCRSSRCCTRRASASPPAKKKVARRVCP